MADRGERRRERRPGRWPAGPGGTLLAIALLAAPVNAQVVAAEPVTEVAPPFPEGVPPIEVQIVLQVLVDAKGDVESAVETSRAPASAPDSFALAAAEAVKKTQFIASTRDGKPIRSRVEYVVVFRPPTQTKTAPTPPPPGPAVSTNQQDEDYDEVVVHGAAWASPRGGGDVRVKRELLDAAPRARTSEMLSAAPGFFVDHDDSEGLGDDVFLRGFDLSHGSGIEMRIGSIPINIPAHVRGQGYADINFVIPEVVRSVRVVEGPYDPRQGDSAIVGSAYFDLGVAERGYQVKTTYGSWNQMRIVGIAAPEEAGEDTFAAFSLRKTDGFGQNRASKSGSAIAQYGLSLGARDTLRLLATAYGARSTLPGVVRADDVEAGRIGYYDSYPFFTAGQGVQSSRVIFGADFDHLAPSGARFEFAPWVMFTDFRARQNYAGNLETAQSRKDLLFGLGDLFETRNVETAAGLTSRFHGATSRIDDVAEIVTEPGAFLRVGHTEQAKSLLLPDELLVWDRRADVGLSQLDAGAYLDVDARIWKRLRLSGGVRADLLVVSVRDRLVNVVPASTVQDKLQRGSVRDAAGIAIGPRITAEYEIVPSVYPMISYGEGFRSLDPAHLPEGSSHPYSKVRSFEAGVHAELSQGRYAATLAAFETQVGNEVVYEAAAGGPTTQNASTRRGVIGSFIAKPFEWLLASTSLSLTSATFARDVANVAHYVPNVPPVLLRVDLTARGRVADIQGKPLRGRAGVGYTFLSARHLNDAVMGPANHILNLGAALRYGSIEIGMDAYNVLGLRYADDAEVYASNWSFRPGQSLASTVTHYVAAPPRTLLGSISIYF